MIQNLKVKSIFDFNNSNKISHTNITLNIIINNCDSYFVLCHKRSAFNLKFSVFEIIGKLNAIKHTSKVFTFDIQKQFSNLFYLYSHR